MRGRGSKPGRGRQGISGQCRSPPVRGRGSKRKLSGLVRHEQRSPPVRGRGSKPDIPRRSYVRRPRRPPCGGVDRNHLSLICPLAIATVAPRAGAWIETLCPQPHVLSHAMSPPVRGRGSKQDLLEDRGARPNLQLGLPLPASMQDERQRGSSIRDPPAASKASDSNAGSDAESSVYRAGFAKPRFLLDSSRCRSVRGAGGCRGTGLGRSPRRTRLLTLIAEIQRRSRSAFNC